MSKVPVRDFDQGACEGCPHRVNPGDSTGRPLIDKLANAESKVLKRSSGEDQHKCGLCGCPLKNLELFGRAPEACPRLDRHGGEQ
jgi:hypothetical protein